MNRIAAGWLLAVIIESSRTAESCLSCYHLKMYNKQVLQKKKIKKKQVHNKNLILFETRKEKKYLEVWIYL